MNAYYNEIDPYAAQWLRNLIAAGHIAPGEVDERSIIDVRPSDLAGFTQCHFFAGIGVWSYALRQAGWPDDRPVWSGSAPCQPFSAAGKGEEFADDRHLWPAWAALIRECRPLVVIGEQVSSKDAYAWLDHVFFDLEDLNYTCGAISATAAGVGAPHIRQRLYWVADANRYRSAPISVCDMEETTLAAESPRGMGNAGGHSEYGISRGLGEKARRRQSYPAAGRSPCREDSGTGSTYATDDFGPACELADAGVRPREWRAGSVPATQAQRSSEGQQHGHLPLGHSDGGPACELADAEDAGQQARSGHGVGVDDGSRRNGGQPTSEGCADRRDGMGDAPGGGWERIRDQSAHALAMQAGAVNGFWSDAEWIACRDGKARPAKPGIFPLAHGATARVGRLRAYGNCIVAPQAAEFVRAFLEA